MATVGQALTSPESGWSRFDTSNLISFNGTITTTYTGSTGKRQEWSGSSIIGTFRFTGSKIRLIAQGSGVTYSSNIKITIDGTAYTFSESALTSTATLVYEKLNLTSGTHIAYIQCNDANYVTLDSMDLETGASLLHPCLNINSDLKTIKLGDMIPCRYTVTTSGTVGVFSELGTCTAAEIPMISSATPNGLFYWIFVGYDTSGRMKFVADRNIQHTITWDTLNTAGICSALPIFKDKTDYGYSIRLLSGGVNANDKNNEWDKIIVESNLGGTITAGDDVVWHWNGISSWTSTTGSSNTNRVDRGYGPVNAWSTSRATSFSGTITGFKPVLLVESLYVYVPKYLIQDGTSIKKYDEVSNTLTTVCSLDALTPEILESDGMKTCTWFNEDIYNSLTDKTKIKILKNKA